MSSGGPVFREGMIESRGAVIRYLEAGEGPSVLFLHGLTEDAEVWLPYMRLAAESGYRAVAIDFRGHGKSSKPQKPPTLGDYAEDVEAAIYALGLGRPRAAAFSLGGFALLKHLERYPHGVEKALLLASAHRPWDPQGMLRRARLARERGMEAVAEEVARLFGEEKRRVFEAYVKPRLLSLDPLVYAATVESLARADLSEALRRAKAKIVIAAGEHDFIAPPPIALEAKKLNPEVEVVELQCKGHMLRAEAPEAVARLIRELLASP